MIRRAQCNSELSVPVSPVINNVLQYQPTCPGQQRGLHNAIHRHSSVKDKDLYRAQSSEADSRLANQEIPRRLCNPKVYCRARKSALCVPILRQTSSIHSPKHYFPNIRFNIILPPTPISSFLAFQSEFRKHFSFPPACYMPRPPHLLHLIILATYRVKVMNFCIIKLPPLSRYFIPLRSKRCPQPVFL
jgi:hypothetical protein